VGRQLADAFWDLARASSQPTLVRACRAAKEIRSIVPAGDSDCRRFAFTTGLRRMGAKYIPSIKDLKANQRFQQKQSSLPKPKKASGAQPAAKKAEKK
jgi:hypothetical protein